MGFKNSARHSHVLLLFFDTKELQGDEVCSTSKQVNKELLSV